MCSLHNSFLYIYSENARYQSTTPDMIEQKMYIGYCIRSARTSLLFLHLEKVYFARPIFTEQTSVILQKYFTTIKIRI
jgi:hypothetical protein